MTTTAVNSLLSTQKSSDSGLQVALHPLALLTISDYVTRHTLRNQKGPIVGALLGQQDGRQITIEHTFDVHMIPLDGEQAIHRAWFDDRLQQMKDVHKSPALDFVGWWTLLPPEGPQNVHLALHREFLDSYNESAILLGFHPSVAKEGAVGGKLPITIYESNFEADSAAAADNGEDKEMTDGESQLGLKFKELQYTVETGEAEMISVDYIARGGGNATAVEVASEKQALDAGKKGKGKAVADDKHSDDVKTSPLTSVEEEKIASLVAKANAVKMLKSRIDLISIYLQSLPPSYIDTSLPESATSPDKVYMPVDHRVLRSVYALLVRLSLIVPTGNFAAELLAETNDVSLVNLLSTLTTSVKDMRETGRKHALIEQGKPRGKSTGQERYDGHGISTGMLNVGDLMN